MNNTTTPRRLVMTAQVRRVCMIAGALLMGAGIAGLLYSLQPRETQTEVPLSVHTLTADADYRVHMTPNTLYAGEWLEEGGVYASALADAVEITFRAAVQGDTPAEITGDYRIEAVLEGYQAAGEEAKKTVYQHSDPLAEGILEGTGAEHTLSVPLAAYRQYSDTANASLGVQVSSDFSVIFSGTVQLNTKHGTKQESFSYAVSLPLPERAALFEITKPAPVSVVLEIAELRSSTAPAQAALAPVFGAVGGAGLVLLLLGVFFTRRPTADELDRAARKALLRKYGSRLVRLSALPSPGERVPVRVHGMEDLLAMAEELRLPVCYAADVWGLPQDGLCRAFAAAFVYEYRLPSAAQGPPYAAPQEAAAGVSTTLVADSLAERGK